LLAADGTMSTDLGFKIDLMMIDRFAKQDQVARALERIQFV
jgi:hypothetical protein